MNKYQYAVGKGNFPIHIIQALESRGNWKRIPEEDALTEADFYWR
jgi:hypothetical protein